MLIYKLLLPKLKLYNQQLPTKQTKIYLLFVRICSGNLILKWEVAPPKTPTKRKQRKSAAQSLLRQGEEELIGPADAKNHEVIQPPTTERTELLIEKETEPLTKNISFQELIDNPIEQEILPVASAIEGEVVERKKGKQKDFPITKTLIKIRLNRTVNINRREENVCELFDLWSYENCVPSTLMKPEDPEKLILSFLPFLRPLLDEHDQLLSNIQEASLLRHADELSIVESRNLSLMSQTEAMHEPLRVSEQNQLIVTVDVHPPPPCKRRKTSSIEKHIAEEPTVPPPILSVPVIDVAPMDENTRLPIQFEETVAPNATFEKQIPPEFIDDLQNISLAPPEVTIETELPSAAERQRHKSLIVDVVEHEEQFKQNRLNNLRRNIKNWDYENQGHPSIEDVCNKPINRLNIAIAFNDLLTLHKMEVIILTTKPDSLDVGKIKKGRKWK